VIRVVYKLLTKVQVNQINFCEVFSKIILMLYKTCAEEEIRKDVKVDKGGTVMETAGNSANLVVRHICNFGLKLMGSKKKKCKDGTWTEVEAAKCKF